MRGHIRKRGNKWAIVVFLGYDEKGKKKYKWFSGYDRKKDAEADLPKKLQEIQNGIFVDSKDTLGAYMQNWLESKARRLRKSTLQSYESKIHQHIIPHLGHIELTKLKAAHLESFYSQLQKGEKPLSNRTVEYIHTLIKGALKRAEKQGLISRNVAELVEDVPKPDKRKPTVWTIEQAMRFLEVTKEHESPRYWIGFLLGLMTGMRKGEILALQWPFVDLDIGYVQIIETLGLVRKEDGKGYELVFQKPKTEKSRRAITLDSFTIDALKEYRNWQRNERNLIPQVYSERDLVISRPDGQPLSPNTFDDAWERSLKRADVPKIRFHVLRHTHATLLLENNFNLKIVSERLGHSTVAITGDIYSHVSLGLQKQVAEQLGNILYNKDRGTLAE